MEPIMAYDALEKGIENARHRNDSEQDRFIQLENGDRSGKVNRKQKSRKQETLEFLRYQQ